MKLTLIPALFTLTRTAGSNPNAAMSSFASSVLSITNTSVLRSASSQLKEHVLNEGQLRVGGRNYHIEYDSKTSLPQVVRNNPNQSKLGRFFEGADKFLCTGSSTSVAQAATQVLKSTVYHEHRFYASQREAWQAELKTVPQQWKANLEHTARSYGLPTNIHTLAGLRQAVETLHGAQTMAYLQERIPTLADNGKLSSGQIELVGEMLKSDELNHFKSALSHEHRFYASQREARQAELKTIPQQWKANLEHTARSYGLPTNIHTLADLRQAVVKLHGAQTMAYLQERIPTLVANGKLSPGQVEFVGELLKSGEVNRFKLALSMVSANPSSPVDTQAKRVVATELARLPLKLLQTADNNHITVMVTHDNVTTYLSQLKGEVAQGHSAGSWDTLSGVSHGKEVVIAMEYDAVTEAWKIGRGHGSANLVLHEFGHSLDHVLGTANSYYKSDKDGNFHKAWHDDYNALGDPYYQQPGPNNDYAPGRNEAFAEGLAKLYGNTATAQHWTNIEKHLAQLANDIVP